MDKRTTSIYRLARISRAFADCFELSLISKQAVKLITTLLTRPMRFSSSKKPLLLEKVGYRAMLGEILTLLHVGTGEKWDRLISKIYAHLSDSVTSANASWKGDKMVLM